MSLAADDHRHGTMNGYSNLGCRCDACRIANSEWKRVNCHINGRHAPRETLMSHGVSRYKAGCKCEICRAAAAAAKRLYRLRHAEEERARWREQKRRQRVRAQEDA